MTSIDDFTWIKWIGSVVLVLLGGLGLRRVNSKVSRESAENDAQSARSLAEEGYFGSALGKSEASEREARLSEHQAWAKVAELEQHIRKIEVAQAEMASDLRHWKANMNLRIKLFRSQHPELDTSWLDDSGFTPLGNR